MKKLFAVLAVLLTLGTASVFAKSAKIGIGAQAGYWDGVGGALTFKLPSVPCVFAVNVGGGYIGGTADWWIANKTFASPFAYYYGVGLYAGVGKSVIAAAPRLLVGTNAFLIDGFLELYLQAAWQPTLVIADELTFDVVNFAPAAGFRFWF